MIQALHDEDFSDLTLAQIAEVFGTTTFSVSRTMGEIFLRTGHRVKYTRKTLGGDMVVTEFGAVRGKGMKKAPH